MKRMRYLLLLALFALIVGAPDGFAQSSITLAWTAPGDDGNVGRATQYDIRLSTDSLTAANWGQATTLSGEPIPSIAGTAETFFVGTLPVGTYYFGIKTVDEAGNWSGLSNIVVVVIEIPKDETPPSVIGDFERVGE